jgi:hypothetical protein
MLKCAIGECLFINCKDIGMTQIKAIVLLHQIPARQRYWQTPISAGIKAPVNSITFFVQVAEYPGGLPLDKYCDDGFNFLYGSGYRRFNPNR